MLESVHYKQRIQFTKKVCQWFILKYGGKMFKQGIKIFYDSMGICISLVLNVKGSTSDRRCMRTMLDTYVFHLDQINDFLELVLSSLHTKRTS
jgi:hypothetical protein